MTVASSSVPIPTKDSVWSLDRMFMIIIAGALGTVAFGIFGQGISPLMGGSNLAPVPLAGSVFKSIAGFGYKPAAYLLHYFAGVICYPLAFALIARPIWQKFAPILPWFVVAVMFGVIQWVFALYVMAHLVAGMPPFLKFSGITWAALYGHIIYALVAIGVSQYLTVHWGSKKT